MTSNPVTLLVKPEVIQVHELKPLPNKAKVQGMVAMRQPSSAGELVGVVIVGLSHYVGTHKTLYCCMWLACFIYILLYIHLI